MPEPRKRRLLRILGYVAFTLFSLVAGLFLSFPYDALRERLRTEADRSGYFLRIASVGPGLAAVRASQIQLSKKAETDPPPQALVIERASFGPSLWPPGLGIKMRALGGTVALTISGSRLRLDAEGIDLSQGNLKGFTGVDLSGAVDGHLALTVPRLATDPDLTQASGELRLDAKDLAVNGGNVSIAIPQFGPEPTPLDLPKILLGNVSVRVKIEKGAATVEDFRAKSADIEANVSGTVKLAKRLEYAEPNLEVRFKPDPEFQKRLGLLGSALSMAGADPKDPSFRMGRLTGYLGRPQFR
jgi:type II secretion system protein N